MKQKIDDNTPVTKKDLDHALKAYPTKHDLKKDLKKTEERLTKSFNKELGKRLTSSQEAFRMESDHKFERMKEEILEGIAVFTDRILTAMDPLIRELETRQQDREIHAAQIKQINERLDQHDKQIKQLQDS